MAAAAGAKKVEPMDRDDDEVTNQVDGSAEVVVQAGRIDGGIHITRGEGSRAPVVPQANGFLGAAPRRNARFVAREQLEFLVTRLEHAEGQSVALVGMGGVGKTVLATAAAHHQTVRHKFRDGIAWLQVEPHTDPRTPQRELATCLAGRVPEFTTVAQGRHVLAGLLAGRDILVVLDNVWRRDVLDAFPPDCQLLFTSRDGGLAQDFDSSIVRVPALSLQQALSLLGNWTGRSQRELDALPSDEICVRLDNLALGVAMVGAMIGTSASSQRWDDILARLVAADLGKIRAEFGEEYPHPTLLAAIALGIDELPDPQTRQRYRELATFNGRGPFSRSAAEALWASSALSAADAGDLLDLYERRSLITSTGAEHYILHDLQADVVARQLGPDALTNAHTRLVTGYRARLSSGWSSARNDGYLFDNLAYHLVTAGYPDELRALLTDLDWLHTKLNGAGLVSLLADYSYLPTDPSTDAMYNALQLSAHVLVNDHNQLPGQLIGRLLGHRTPVVRRLLDSARHWDAPWLCPLIPISDHVGGHLARTLVHPSAVAAVAVSPSGHVVTASGADVRVWDLRSGRELHTFDGHRGNVLAVAVGPDGRRVVSAGGDRVVRVWHLQSGREMTVLRGHTDSVTAAAVTADSARAVTAGLDGAVRVWDLAEGRELREFTGHHGAVWAVAVTPDGHLVVSGGDDGTVRVWDLAEGRELRELTGHHGAVWAVAVTPDGCHVLSGGTDGKVVIWNLATGTRVRTLTDTGQSGAVAVTADGRRVVSVNYDYSIRVSDFASGRELRTMTGHSDTVAAVAVSSNGRQVISGSSDRTVRVWRLDSNDDKPRHRGQARMPIPQVVRRAVRSRRRDAPDEGHLRSVDAMAIAPSGDHVVSGGHDGTIRVWQAQGGRQLHVLHGHQYPVRAVAVSPDCRHIVSGGDDGAVRVWDLARGRALHVLTGHSSQVAAVAIGPDGRHVVSGNDDGTIRIWDLANGFASLTLRGHHNAVVTVAVSADGRHIVSGSDDGTVGVWDLAEGRARYVLAGHDSPVLVVAVSLDGRHIASGAYADNSILVWETDSGRQARAVRWHDDAVRAAAITSDLRHAVSAGYDGTARVWCLDRGQEVARWTTDQPIASCAVHAGPPLTIAVGEDGGAVHTLELRGLSTTEAKK